MLFLLKCRTPHLLSLYFIIFLSFPNSPTCRGPAWWQHKVFLTFWTWLLMVAHGIFVPSVSPAAPLEKCSLPFLEWSYSCRIQKSRKDKLWPQLLGYIGLQDRKYNECWAAKLSSYTNYHPRICKILCIRKLWNVAWTLLHGMEKDVIPHRKQNGHPVWAELGQSGSSPESERLHHTKAGVCVWSS